MLCVYFHPEICGHLHNSMYTINFTEAIVFFTVHTTVYTLHMYVFELRI